MPSVGDRIAVAASKGAPSKRGTVVDCVGRMLVVEWDDGRRTSFYPAPGSVTVETPAAASPPARRLPRDG